MFAKQVGPLYVIKNISKRYSASIYSLYIVLSNTVQQYTVFKYGAFSLF